MNVCGAKTRSGKPCQKSPLDGSKRCALHGGKSPRADASPQFVTGRYSKYMKQSLQDKMATVVDENPLDLLPELQVQRALLAEYIARFREGMPLGMGDIDALIGWSSEIGRTVERVVKMRNDTALTAAEVALIAARIPEVVARFIDDPDRQRRFVDELFSAVGLPPENQRQLSPHAGDRDRAASDGG